MQDAQVRATQVPCCSILQENKEVADCLYLLSQRPHYICIYKNLTSFRQTHDYVHLFQHWAIIKGAASLTRC